MRAVPDSERNRRATRDYTIGDTFIESLEAHIIDRRRVIQVAVDVLTRDVYTLHSRHAHPLRPNATGSCGQVKRERDSALAWRANLSTNTPGAPQLHWWELPNGTVELAQAAHHDNMSIR